MRERERVETLVIGGGQSGLAMSHMLKQRSCPHLVLERRRIAERWRSERWDGLRFQFPNWSVRLPDFPFHHEEPDGFASTAEIVDYLAAYAAFVDPPIRCGVEVTSLRRSGDDGEFLAETTTGAIRASNVVIATGPYQRPVMPTLLAHRTDVFQVHASHYTNPSQLPAGAVLVVGSGASGAQIAEELLRAGRRVYLSVGHHRRFPRRYRGRDLIWWLAEMGLDRTLVEKRGPDRSLPLITGAYGGHTIDFRQFAGEGIVLLGRLQGESNGILQIADDLVQNLAYGDAACTTFMDMVDAHVAGNGSDTPEERAARAALPDPQCVGDPIRTLELRSADITAVIWSTGYAYDYAWIDLPAFDAGGEPKHRKGVAEIPGYIFSGCNGCPR